MNYTKIKLVSGLVVANFSSPHAFTFNTGEVLPSCDSERSKALMLSAVESTIDRGKWTDIKLVFEMTKPVWDEIKRMQADESIDIIIVPLPVLEAMKNACMPIGKCRVVRVADRIAKTIHSDRFCV